MNFREIASALLNSITRERGWRSYMIWFFSTLFALIASSVIIIFIANPYRNIPFAPWKNSPIMDIEQRFHYPALARSPHYNSSVFGTSTGRLLRPAKLNDVLTGAWAQMSMNNATAYEQYRLAKLFMLHHPQALHILHTVDGTWCGIGETYQKFTRRRWPEWMFDENPWNDLPKLLDSKTIEIAVRAFGYILGKNKVRLGNDGYSDFTPENTHYDLGKVLKNLYGEQGKRDPKSDNLLYSEGQLAAFKFPTHRLLEELYVNKNANTKLTLAFMPYHYFIQGAEKGKIYQVRTECKNRLVEMFRMVENVDVVDFMFHSPITKNDLNYWDSLHYKREVADLIVRELAENSQTENMRVLK